jgi:hypothetical protein
MYNRWCLLWHILHKYGKLTLGNDACNTLNQKIESMQPFGDFLPKEKDLLE